MMMGRDSRVDAKERSQIDKLADFIMNEVDGEPSQDEGAGDCAIRIIRKLQSWVNDLQSGMYINCVYCGHRYGPNDEVPASMADVLKAHVEKCPKHPMFELKTLVEELKLENADLRTELDDLKAVLSIRQTGGKGNAF